MASNITDLRTELRDRIGKRTTTALTDARLDTCLRGSIVRNASPRIYRHPSLESKVVILTVAGTDIYALTPVWGIFTIRCPTPGNIRRVRVMGFQRMLELEKTSGPPLRYARYGNNIHLDPIPNGVYSLDIYAYVYPTFATPLAGVSPLEAIHDEAVLIMAESIAFTRVLKDPAHGKELMLDWREEVGLVVAPNVGDYDDNDDFLAPDFGD